jgi:hypothetical protein
MSALFRRSAAAAPQTLDPYDIAYLAGGRQRVAEAALIALRDRGVITISGPRVRAGEELPCHPVERMLTGLCPRGKSVARVREGVLRSPQVKEIGRRLVAYGLLTRFRRRPTRAGRRHLEAARRGGAVPAYVFDGPAVLPERLLRRNVGGTPRIPSGLGRSLVRMGKAIDSDSDRDASAHADSGHTCGSGSGGDY